MMTTGQGLIYMRVRVSKVQGGQCSRSGIEFWYKDLGRDALELLLVWVDKENSIEFLFVFCTVLIHIFVFTLIYKVLRVSFESFPLVRLVVWPSHDKFHSRASQILWLWCSHNSGRFSIEKSTLHFNPHGSHSGRSSKAVSPPCLETP